MALAWSRPETRGATGTGTRTATRPSWETVAPARVAPERPWILYVGVDADALDAAARVWLEEHEPRGLTVLAPPETPPLAVALHRLVPPETEGEKLVWAPRLDEAFLPGPFSAGSPLYLLPLLARTASGGAPLAIVGTALETKVPDLVAQRGLWSRFEIRRVAGVSAGADDGTPPDSAQTLESALEAEEGSGLSLLFATRGRPPRDAVPLLREAIALEPDLPAAHYELGKALIATDDIDGATAAFRRTTELLPDYASAWGNLGAALGEVQKLDESTEALTRAVGLDPLNHAMHSNLGVAHRDQGRLDDARAHLERAIALAPDFAFGHYNLASVLYLSEHYREAIAAFEQGRGLDTSRSPRQSLLLAVTRLAAGDIEEAMTEYRDVFARLGRGDAPMKKDMRTVAEWDLKQLASRVGVSEPLREAAKLLRSLA